MFTRIRTILGFEQEGQNEPENIQTPESSVPVIETTDVETSTIEETEIKVMGEEKTPKDKLFETCEKISKEICNISEKLSQNVADISKKTVERISQFTDQINKEFNERIESNEENKKEE